MEKYKDKVSAIHFFLKFALIHKKKLALGRKQVKRMMIDLTIPL
jgi:hypothetical protein